MYVQLLKAAAALAALATSAQSKDFDLRVVELQVFSVGELQMVASPKVNTAFGDVLHIIDSFKAGKAGTAEVYGTLCKLAIACHQDSVREFQLDPKQQEEFEQNAQIMAKVFKDLLPGPPTGLQVSPE